MPAQLLSHVQLLVTPCTKSAPGLSVHGVFQARILEWVAISSSRRSSQPEVRPTSPAWSGRFFYRCATREAPFSVSGVCVFLTFSVSLCPGLWFWVHLFCLLCCHDFSLVLNFSMRKLLVIQEMSLSFWFLHWVLITSCVFTIIRHSWCLLASKPFGGVGDLAVYGLTPSVSCGSHFGLNCMFFLGIRLLLPLKN